MINALQKFIFRLFVPKMVAIPSHPLENSIQVSAEQNEVDKVWDITEICQVPISFLNLSLLTIVNEEMLVYTVKIM